MFSQNVKQKLYVNFLILVIAVAIFYLFSLPQYYGSGTFYNPLNNVKTLSEQKLDYKDAISQADNYLFKINKVHKDYVGMVNSQTGNDLKNMIPESVEPVEVLNELNSIALQNKILLISPRFTEDSNTNNEKNYLTLILDFGFEGTYPLLKAFLHDLETSKRIYNIKNLSFSSGPGTRAVSNLTYQVSVETYYLKNSK